MSRPLIIYHGPGCMDGFTAAWVAWLRLGDGADYEPAAYGEAPPDVAGTRSRARTRASSSSR